MKRTTIGGKPKLIFEPKVLEDTLDDLEALSIKEESKDEFELPLSNDHSINAVRSEKPDKAKVSKKLVKQAANRNVKPENGAEENVEFISELPAVDECVKRQVEPLFFGDSSDSYEENVCLDADNFFLIQMPRLTNPVLFRQDGCYFVKSDDGLFKLRFSTCDYNVVEINNKFKVYGGVKKFAVAEKIE